MIYDSTRSWNTPPANITFSTNNEHGIFLKVPTEEGVSTSEWIVSETHIDPLRDDGYIIYKLGRALAVADGKREVSMIFGNVRGGSGASAFVYIAYASDAAGTGFTLTFNPALKYIAVKHTTAPIAAPVVGDFAGLWAKYVGENGEPGDDGAPGAPGNDGREVEMSVQAGWLCWRYVGDVSWTQLYQIPGEDNSIVVRIDFQDLTAFEYTAPVAMKFTLQTSEGTAATLDPALNTNLDQFDTVIITPTVLGLVILEGVQL